MNLAPPNAKLSEIYFSTNDEWGLFKEVSFYHYNRNIEAEELAFNQKMETYNVDFLKYQEENLKYEKELTDYNQWKKDQEIKKLEDEIQRLKNNK